jgi:hypothetical protein
MSRAPPAPKRPPRPATPAALCDAIRDEALRLGFDAVGFAPASLAPEARRERLQRLTEFVEAGWQGDMGWLGERTEARADPQRLWHDAKTVVSLALNYAPAGDPLEVLKASERAAISVYAQGRDYHEVMKTKLKALGRFIWDTYRHDLKVFVDTAPLMEKHMAQAVGHGWQGKHTNLVSRKFGSWLFLGELLLSVELPADPPETDHCGQCHACLDICPTPTGSMRGAASPTSPSSMKARSSARCGHCSATASMAATIAWRSAPGTSSPSKRTRRRWRPDRRSTRRCWPSSPRWMIQSSAAASPARRSSASAAIVSSATSPMRWATAVSARPCCRPSKSF